MRKLILGTVLTAVVLLAASGCDFIRASLGKPTSTDLALLRWKREMQAQDSLAAARDSSAVVRDSTVAQDSTVAPSVPENAVPEVNSPAPVQELKRYYVVAGAFKEESGVKAYSDKLVENGYPVHRFDFKSGLKVVCLEGSDTLAVARRQMAGLKAARLFPGDPWIYNTKQKLHKEI